MIGMPPATAASKLSATPLLLGQLGELEAVLGEQRLVGGDDVLAGVQRRFDGSLGDAVLAADQLDEHLDRRIACERHGIVEPFDALEIDAAALVRVCAPRRRRRMRDACRRRRESAPTPQSPVTPRSKLQEVPRRRCQAPAMPNG